MAESDIRRVQITVVPSPGCLASSVTGPVDLLYAANAVARARGLQIEFVWTFASPRGGPVASSSGVTFETRRLRAAAPAHAVLVTGPGVTEARSLLDHLDALRGRSALRRWVHEQCDAGAVVTAGCTGVFVLAELGLAEGRSVTTTWWLADEFRRRYPDTRLSANAMVVPDGPLVTAGAAMAHLDLALHLIGHFGGPELAQLAARYTIVDLERSSQAVYAIAAQTQATDPLVRRAVSVLTGPDGLHRSVADLAGELGTTPRTLHRRFTACVRLTPREFIARERVRRAKDLLEATTLDVDEIAARVGFHDPSAFRRAFKRDAEVTPGAYRRRFAPRPATR